MNNLDSLESTKIVIKSILIATPEPLTIPKLDREYYEQEGHRIPYSQLGYANLKAFLQSIPDTVRIDFEANLVKAVVNKDSAAKHIHKLVSEQKKPSKKRTNNTSHSSAPVYPQQKHLNNNNLLTKDNLEVLKQVFSPGNLLNTPYMFNNTFQHGNSLIATAGASIIARQLLYSQQPQLNRRFESNTASVRKFNQINVYSASQETGSINGNFSQIKISPHKTRVGTKETLPCKRNLERKPKQVAKTESSKRLPSNNEKCNAESSNLSKTLNNGNSIIQENETSKIESSQHGTIGRISKCLTATPELHDDDPIKFIGKKQINTKLPGPTIPDELLQGKQYEIVVSEVHDPWRFWFHLCDYNQKLIDLQKRLQSYYSNPQNVVDNDCNINIGSACVALFDNKWLRAEVCGHEVDGQYKLHFVDFGTVDYVSIGCIKKLCYEFCLIPRLAYRGSLNLHYIGSCEAKTECTRIFCEMINNKRLIAVVNDIDYKHFVVTMTIIDTNLDDVDVIVNKEIHSFLLKTTM